MAEHGEFPEPRPASALAKRGFDIVTATVALLVLAIPLLIVILAIRLQDTGPIFYRQMRVGRGGHPFRMFKFRSMVVNADQVGGYATAVGDRRITPVGRILRRTSVDEVPQLLNVLRGDMSIVGPRPDVPAQQALYTPEDWQMRHRVRPGITGLAQAVSRSTATAQERTELDLDYVRQASLWFDMKIILLTLRQLVAKTGN